MSKRPRRQRACWRRRGGGRARLRSRLVRALLPALVVAGLGCDGMRQGPDRIVLVTIDTLRADRVGAYGDLGARTPTLDEIASRGARFEQAIAPTPLTLPSHASLMTGRQPPAHGVRHNSVFEVDEELPLLAERMAGAGYATGAFIGAFVLDARFGLARGFEVYDDRLSQRSAARGLFSFAERRADEVVDAALAWLDEAPPRFFLWVHLFDPHADYDPPRRFARELSDPYAGEVAFADAEVGRLLQHVLRRFGRESLVVAVTSDHGESMGEHNESTHSYTVYDATQRVPLLLMGPDVPPGRVVEEQVRLVDVAPTLLQIAGAQPLEDVEGRSLLPLLLEPESTEARPAYVETLATQLDMGWSPLLGVRTGAYKYIRAPQPELYDLREDPGETRNLALVQPERARELDRLLETRLERARPVEGSLELAPEDRARLESLGYVVPEARAFGGELGEVGGPNPRDHMLDAARTEEARGALAEGDPLRALEILEPLGEGGLHLSKVRAHAAMAAGQPERAVATLEVLRERGQATARELAELGVAYAGAEQLEDARSAYEAARTADPELAAPLTGLGFLALQEGDLEAAERWLLEAEERAAQPEASRVDRAILRLHQGRTEEAEALLDGLEPSFLAEPMRATRLAAAEHAAGRGERAVEVLRRALRERPKHRQLLGAQADLLGALGRFDEALRFWRRLHALDPEDPGSKNDLAWGLALAGRDLDHALALSREAARALDDDPTVLDTLATVHLARSEPAEALAVAGRALAEDADADLRPHLLYVRAAALAELGRTAEARDVLAELRAEDEELVAPWKERAVALERRVGLETEPSEGDAKAAEGAPRAAAPHPRSPGGRGVPRFS